MRTETYNREQVKQYAKKMGIFKKSTVDSYARRLSSYQYEKMRMLHIEGVRKW